MPEYSAVPHPTKIAGDFSKRLSAKAAALPVGNPTTGKVALGPLINQGEQLRVGLLHINDQTVNDEVVNPIGGGASGNGTSIGGLANWEEFTQWQWMTMKGTAPL